MEVSPMKSVEVKYAHEQSARLCKKTGYIGSLKADFGKDNGFFYSWDNRYGCKLTDSFTEAFSDIITELRCKGDFLYDRKAMLDFCYNNQNMQINEKEYGLTIDRDRYKFLIRLNPRLSESNFTCYCYESMALRFHILDASMGICFITPDFNTQFRIDDGDTFTTIGKDGKKELHKCRYYTLSKVEIDGKLYDIEQYTEKLKNCGKYCEPSKHLYPPACFSVDPTSGRLIVIKRYENGFTFVASDPSENPAKTVANILNSTMGVTKAQTAAMTVGALRGWKSDGANVHRYDLNGEYLRPKLFY